MYQTQNTETQIRRLYLGGCFNTCLNDIGNQLVIADLYWRQRFVQTEYSKSLGSRMSSGQS